MAQAAVPQTLNGCYVIVAPKLAPNDPSRIVFASPGRLGSRVAGMFGKRWGGGLALTRRQDTATKDQGVDGKH